MDDSTEFETRVHYRTTDPKDLNDPPPADPIYVGEITRINVPPFGGVMQMATHSSVPGKLSASSVAAKGSFARAGAGEKLGISFDYSFRPGCNPNAELIVRLAQDRTVGAAGDLEVARIRPPPPGQPGSIGGGFATFSMKVPRGSLNFTHGTYVELVLTGTDSLLWVPILNPVVVCRPTCGDIDGVPGVTATDFLVLLASYGGELMRRTGVRECLDSGVSRDYFVDIADVIGWSPQAAWRHPLLRIGSAGAARLRSRHPASPCRQSRSWSPENKRWLKTSPTVFIRTARTAPQRERRSHQGAVHRRSEMADSSVMGMGRLTRSPPMDWCGSMMARP